MSSVHRLVVAALAAAVTSALVAACSSAPPAGQATSSASTSASGSGATSGTGGAGMAVTYHASECGTCVETTACIASVNACSGDPGCAAYLDCLDACAVGPDGDADAACEKACPAVSGTAGQDAKAAFVDCRFSGDGATACAACGKTAQPKDADFHQVCQPSTETNPCFVCEDEHCCDTYEACHVDADCGALVTCLKGCVDADAVKREACIESCDTGHPAGFVAYGHRIACITHFCADGDACGNAPLDPCVKCVNAQCADESAACQHDLQCTLLQGCEAQCDATDQACFTTCETKFPASKAILEARNDCGIAHCVIACGGSMP